MGLNLNASKANFFDRRGFFLYHSFDIFKLLAQKRTASLVKAFKLFKSRDKSGVSFKKEPILKKILNSDVSKVPMKMKLEILNYVLEDDFLMNIDTFYLNKIYELLDDKAKKDFIRQLSTLSGKVLFNQYHLRVLNFAKQNKLDDKSFEKIKDELNKIEKLEILS